MQHLSSDYRADVRAVAFGKSCHSVWAEKKGQKFPPMVRIPLARAYNSRMNIRRMILVCVVAWVGTPGQSLAGWSCGIDASLLPQIYALEVVDDRLRAYVGPIERVDDGRRTVATAVAANDDATWTVQSGAQLPVRRASVYSEACMAPPPDEEWLKANRPWWSPENSYFEQRVGVCVTGSGKRWGGIAFYGGEGYGGVGGIVEEDIEKGSFRYYRPRKLLDLSTSHLAYFGDNLWIGTAWYGECGTGVGVGVLSAFFDNDEMYADWTLGAGTCGFQVSDMVVHSGALWIATELGLSKVSLSGSRYRYKKFDWTNYVPTGDAENPMREVTCDELYEELFQSQELADAPANDDGLPYAVLWGRISELRPNFAWKYVQKLNGLEPRREKKNSE